MFCDQFSKPFKRNLERFCKFINSMIEERNYCSDMMKKYFSKEFMMNKADNEDFELY